MLRHRDVARFAAQYGVSDAQVLRDHFISHILAALPKLGIPDFHFFGGTALCRTYLDGQRLSEDIDLLQSDFASSLEEIAVRLPGFLRREFPGLTHQAGRTEGSGRFIYMTAQDVPPVKVYVGALHVERPAWRFVPTAVPLRYPDLPHEVELSCPTVTTFAAMKMEAYLDRHAPRDLFDLAGLARLGALDLAAATLLRATTGLGFIKEEFSRVPPRTAAAWQAELSQQATAMISPEECRTTIALALDRQRGEEPLDP